MAIKLKFDLSGNAQLPTMVLMTKNGQKLGSIPAYDISLDAGMNKFNELFFSVNKIHNGAKYHLWDKLKSLKLIHCPEWNQLFDAKVEICESNSLIKNVTAKSLGESELSQINIYNVEINTEEDILRDDYIPTKLFNRDNHSGSLLHRIMEKAPHYKIAHVDDTIANLQRIFSFNDISIYDAFLKIAEEMECFFDIVTRVNSEGKIDRLIYVYDLKSYCCDCHERGDFLGNCPNCGGSNILTGYGEDTSIFISADNLADEINLTADTDSVKNCFKLIAGDEYMTSVISNCNPGGSDYLWYISDDQKEDMSPELIDKLKAYDEACQKYSTGKIESLSDVIKKYNDLVLKYSKYSDSLKVFPEEIVGYPALMELYYDTIDFSLFLNSGLMPNVELQETTAENEASKLTSENIGVVAVANAETCSDATASSAALSMAKTIVDSRYQVKVKNGTLSDHNWIGSFIVTNYSDEEDTAESQEISILVNDNYETFVRQKIEKALNNQSDDVTNISGLFKLDIDEFKEELKKYCLSRLTSFYDSCQACLNIMIEQGVSDESAADVERQTIYSSLYSPYYEKLLAIQEEISVRESDIAVIIGKYDENGNLIAYGLQTSIDDERSKIQGILNFKDFLGEDLWMEFVPYRREDTYQNDNYVSDGLNNSELFQNALSFIEAAKKEIIKSGTIQHSITGTLKNLLVMPEFKSIVDHFALGNWIRIKIDDGIYRLRLIQYNIDFNNVGILPIEFSDVTKTSSGINDVRSIISQASSISASYNAVTHQVEKSNKEVDALNRLVENGLSLTNTKIMDSSTRQDYYFDQNGMIFRRFDDVASSYDPCQLKLINSTLAITDDNWKNVEAAIGKIYYKDPKTGKVISDYGVNARVLIGQIILGNSLGIYNEAGTLNFNEDGFIVKNDVNSFIVNPNSDTLLAITHDDDLLFGVNEKGQLYVKCDGTDVDINNNSSVMAINSLISRNSDSILEEEKRAESVENELAKIINKLSSNIDDEEFRAKKSEGQLKSMLTLLSDRIATLEEGSCRLG